MSRALGLLPVAESLLAHVVRWWPAADPGTHTKALPARRLLLAGSPEGIAWDCEHLAVALDTVTWGPGRDAAPLSQRTGAPVSAQAVRWASLSVTLVRCTPTGGNRGIPTDDELNDAGTGFLRDAGLLSQCVVEWASKRDDNDPAALFQGGDVASIGPSGGFHGLEALVAVTVTRLGD